MIKFKEILKEDLDLSKYDLKKKFDYFNELYFEDKIRKDTILRWSKTIRVGGTCKARIRKIRRALNMELLSPMTISISQAYIREKEEDLDGILLHEMIHAYFWSIGIEANHGKYFKAMLNKVSNLSEIKVPLTDDGNVINTNVIKSRNIYVVITWRNGILRGIMPYNANWFNSNLKKVVNYWHKINEEPKDLIAMANYDSKFLKINYEIKYISNCKEGFNLKLARTNRIVHRYYPPKGNEKEIEYFLNNGKTIYKFNYLDGK